MNRFDALKIFCSAAETERELDETLFQRSTR